jgi:hypothetical protein
MTGADKPVYVQPTYGPTPKPREHTIDPATGIWPIAEWGGACARGFVAADRFATHGEQVIKRTARKRKRA